MESRITYGIQAVRKALARGRIERLYLLDDVGPKRLGRLSADIASSAVPVTVCTGPQLEQLTGTKKHQGVAASVTGSGSLTEREAREFVLSLEMPLLLVLDGIQDPRNFGSLLRTADAAGVDLVITARNRNVAVTPVVSKVASGAAEAQPLAEVGNLARFLEFVAGAGIRIVGTDESAPLSLYDADLAGALAIVLGGEGEGMRRLTREHCDVLVSLPMQGVVESLNVSVAAGICLFESVRQRSRLAPTDALR
jgi:23S rRNA (guanosine2251-2'-O)-methyltransferase